METFAPPPPLSLPQRSWTVDSALGQSNSGTSLNLSNSGDLRAASSLAPPPPLLSRPLAPPSALLPPSVPLSSRTCSAFQGSDCRVEGSCCRVQGAGFRLQGAGFMVQGAGSRVQGAECRAQGAGCRVQGPVVEPHLLRVSGFRLQG